MTGYKSNNIDNKHRRLKPHHHVCLTGEHKLDLELWLYFLYHPSAHSRPFWDFRSNAYFVDSTKHTDASKNPDLRCRGWCENEWFMTQWDSDFIKSADPSIAYLELYRAAVGILLWIRKFTNRAVIIHCDNQSVIHMINNSSSSCKNCMILIRVIVLECLIRNVKIRARYINTEDNGIADALSHFEDRRFHFLTQDRNMDNEGQRIPYQLCPMKKLYSN